MTNPRWFSRLKYVVGSYFVDLTYVHITTIVRETIMSPLRTCDQSVD